MATVLVVVGLGACAIGFLPTMPAGAQPPDEIRRRADQLVVSGIEAFRQSRPDEAFRAWQHALGLYESIGDRQRQMAALQNLGAGSRRLGRHDTARDYLARALMLARERADADAERELLEELAQTHRALGDLRRAIEIYEDVVAAALAKRDAVATRRALGSLGQLHAASGDPDRALQYLRRALELARRTGHRQDEGAALWNIGEVELVRERYVDAIAGFWRAALVARELGDARREAAALLKLGTAHYFLGDYGRAEHHFRQSLELARNVKDLSAEGVAWQGLGSVHYFAGRLDGAVAAYEKALEIARALGDRSREGRALGNLALAQTARGEHGKAIAYAERDLAISRDEGNRQAEAQALTNLATAHHHRGDHARATDYSRQSLTLARAIGYRRGEGIALTNLGHALLRSGHLDAAETALRQALGVLEGLRERAAPIDAYHVSLFETQLRAYSYLQIVLVNRSRAEAALEVAERGRAQALARLLAPRGPPVGEARLEAAPPTLDQIREAVRSRRATLVEYSAVPEESALFIWVVQPNGRIVFHRVALASPDGTWSSLEELVSRTRQALGVRARGARGSLTGAEDEQWRRALHDLLIAPIAGELPSDPAAPVILVPQGPLFLVPFSALLDRAGRDLIERHTIAIAPSIQTLELARSRRGAPRPRGGQPLVVGNPAMPSVASRPGESPRPLAPLPGAEREAMAVARLLGTQALLGHAATKAAVTARMRDARIIHLATHGLVEDVKGIGIPGAIALAPSPGDDGLLGANEILDVELAAELVVLSACDTGRGRLSGDGVIGLSRSVIAAGAASVVVSLWPVPDVRTAELMTAFYRRLQGSSDRAGALRQAALEVRSRDPDPVAWAGFVLVGEIR